MMLIVIMSHGIRIIMTETVEKSIKNNHGTNERI